MVAALKKVQKTRESPGYGMRSPHNSAQEQVVDTRGDEHGKRENLEHETG